MFFARSFVSLVLSFSVTISASPFSLGRRDALESSAASSSTSGNLQVDLGYAIYRGVENKTMGLNTWKGIRFAAPPTGSRRWQIPQKPATDRSTVHSADTFGPSCPQSFPTIPNPPFIPGNEDCLFLNVYAPKNAKGLPVLIWIHGGGYGLGDGTQDISAIINDNAKSFVAVTIQYRLGAFGFLSSAEVHDKGVANAGLLDQAFAIKWVHNNIALFGGDPSKVTISGESAGAGSVVLHNLAAGGQAGPGYFSNSIAASPYLPAQYNYNDPEPEYRFRAFAKQAGCGSSPPIFECLVAKDSMTLQMASNTVSTTHIYGTWAFLPVTDGYYIQRTASQQLLQKKLNGLRVLAGNNANEGPLFVPPNITTQNDLINYLQLSYPRLSSATINQILANYPSSSGPVNPADPKYATDGDGPGYAINISQVATGQQQRAYDIYAEATFVCPSYWLNQAFTAPSRIGYKYQYSVPFASHTDDIPAYFGPATPNQSSDFTLAFRRIWGNFITKNNPSISNQIANGASSANPSAANVASNWPAYTDTNPKMINLNETGGTPYTAITNFGVPVTQFQGPSLRNDIKLVDANKWEANRGARCAFWRSIARQIPV